MLAVFSVEGVSNVILKPDSSGQFLHRGFIFADFINHKYASTAKKMLNLPTVKIFNKNLFADWAEPQAEVSDEVMATVRAAKCPVSILSNSVCFLHNRLYI